jgi:mannosyltransferase OCH1-like enzyme
MITYISRGYRIYNKLNYIPLDHHHHHRHHHHHHHDKQPQQHNKQQQQQQQYYDKRLNLLYKHHVNNKVDNKVDNNNFSMRSNNWTTTTSSKTDHIRYQYEYDSINNDNNNNIIIIPKIIHQTYKTFDSIPDKWLYTQQLVRTHNADFEYMFWTDVTLREFLHANYPYFLSTYDSYRYTIQRIDAVRYFLLYHYGGFYIDLDIGISLVPDFI